MGLFLVLLPCLFLSACQQYKTAEHPSTTATSSSPCSDVRKNTNCFPSSKGKKSFVCDFFKKVCCCLKKPKYLELSTEKIATIRQLALTMKIKKVSLYSTKKVMNLAVINETFEKDVQAHNVEAIIHTHTTNMTQTLLGMARIYHQFRSLFTQAEWELISADSCSNSDVCSSFLEQNTSPDNCTSTVSQKSS